VPCTERLRQRKAVKNLLTVVGHDSEPYRKKSSLKGSAMPNLEEAIRERAYHLWIADGQPEGKAEVYWLSAQREIPTMSFDGSSETPVTTHMDSASSITKPAKAKVSRSGKSKFRTA
jgi:Protein of unknown function (DUF2934)